MTKKTTTVKDADKNLPVNWDEELARFAQEAAAAEKSAGGSQFISLKGGDFTFKQNVIPSPMRVIVLASAFDNAYYLEQFDPDNPSVPACFAVGLTDENLAPHETSPKPQHETCAGCPMNEFGSGNGRGKACKNSRRLAVVAEEDVIGSEDPESAEVAMMRLPPTSLKYWAGYVKKIASVMKRPPFGVVTSLALESEKTYYVVKPSFADVVKDRAAMAQILELRKMALEDVVAPYDVSSFGEPRQGRQRRAPVQSKPAQKGGKRAKY